MTDLAPVRRALLSVSDKAGLVDQTRALSDFGVEILSTGGTGAAIAAAGLPVRDVAAVTGSPEVMDGRVKTLHPRIHGGLLADRSIAQHLSDLDTLGAPPIDLLIVNLYPFEDALARGAADTPEMIETIDVGGPAMIRAAAKNHAHVAVCTDAGDVAAVLEAMANHGGATPLSLRRRLAAKAFARTAAYDAVIAGWFARTFSGDAAAMPPSLALGGRSSLDLRYGENPHQRAAFYAGGEVRPGVATARLVQGKALSYNNLNDTDAAFELVAELDPDGPKGLGRPAIAIIKHANPCGAALGASLADAYARALACDPVSAFGGVVAANRSLDRAAAEAITAVFTEVVIAPGADDEALAVFAKRPNLRLLLTGGLPDPRAPGLAARSLSGGLLVQTRDDAVISLADLTLVTKRAPSDAELRDLLFAWRIAKHVKSNAIVYAKDEAVVGVGAGQMSRIDSARIAASKARDAAVAAGGGTPLTIGSACASDAFFPFPDGLMVAAEAGASAVIQPGGSIRDADVIAAADSAGLAMVFTGVRHFRH